MKKRIAWSHGLSILLHVAVLASGGFWLHRKAEVKVAPGDTSVEVTLVEAPPDPPPPTPAPTPFPLPPPLPPPTPGDVPAQATPLPPPAPAPSAPPRPKPVRPPRQKPKPNSSSKPAPSSPGARGSANVQYLLNPAPPYPESARAAGEEGSVMLFVEVDAKGRPARVRVSRSSGFADLDAAAVRAVRRWRFTPATVAGAAVSSSINVPVQFQLTGN